jgi:signal transduction histidine kinase
MAPAIFCSARSARKFRLKRLGVAGLWQAEVDPNHLEAALVNLAINARDAMPNGGKLTLEGANIYVDQDYAQLNPELPPGQYVVLCVSDTGIGMEPDVLEHAFEPFFTTKELGHGTGLGLSQVYGFVKQSGGHIKIYSELNQGTTVKIYLPRLIGSARDEANEPDQMVVLVRPIGARIFREKFGATLA